MKYSIAVAAVMALMSAATVANAASGSSGRFCVQDRDAQEGQPSRCFATIAQCRQEAIGTGTCVRNPRGPTTGSGGNSGKTRY